MLGDLPDKEEEGKEEKRDRRMEKEWGRGRWEVMEQVLGDLPDKGGGGGRGGEAE